MTTWADLLAGATAQLTAAGVDSPAADARWLAEAVAGKRPHPRDTPPPAQRELFAAYLARRAAREPLQHITGRMYFRYLELVSTPDALIVRPETEIVAECAIAHVRACVAAQNCGNAASLKNDDAAAARSPRPPPRPPPPPHSRRPPRCRSGNRQRGHCPEYRYRSSRRPGHRRRRRSPGSATGGHQ
ncbi:hypothetical protein PWJ88_00540 [Actinotignum schaalii]|uniref:hypothetical protein n=1 Tax=Actinotignum schaalii TaxID=59505 RepID=UPI00265A0A0B|nr:hypothetical protein [Actinotignum schaalii]MDE1662548.1 hypothetical protein [Actinotignum schaalii]